MKGLLVVLMGLFCLKAIAQSLPFESRPPQVLAGPFDWTRDLEAIGQVPGTSPGGGFPADVLPFHVWNTTPTIYTLRILGPSIISKITSKHYAIIGHLRYSAVAAGSFFELENWFASEKPGNPESFYYSRTLADAGPMAKIEGSDDGRDFPCPSTPPGPRPRSRDWW